MRGQIHRRNSISGIGWLSLGYLYSGAAWMVAAVVFLLLGAGVGAGFAVARLAVTLWLGVGLCAQERWAWASVVCQAALVLLFSASAALLAAVTLATLPHGSLSWQPILLGLRRDSVILVGTLGTALAAVGGGVLTMLWREQGQFNVPYRRAFVTLTELGAAPALLAILLDAYLVWGWWVTARVG